MSKIDKINQNLKFWQEYSLFTFLIVLLIKFGMSPQMYEKAEK